MLDDDDLDFAILAWPSGKWIVTIVGIVAIILLFMIVRGNRAECESKHCDHGVGRLINNECLCVEKPKN